MSGYLKPAVLLLLIFFSHQTFELALEGLELWYTCVVPALLPAVFMIKVYERLCKFDRTLNRLRIIVGAVPVISSVILRLAVDAV